MRKRGAATKGRGAAAVSRSNGQLGGRPRALTEKHAELLEQARQHGRAKLIDCVRLWCDLITGRRRGTNNDRLAASRELADRLGLPRLSRQEVMGNEPAVFKIEVKGVEGGLGWPPPLGPAAEAADDDLDAEAKSEPEPGKG